MFRANAANHYKITVFVYDGPVAQRLEQRTHNPLVPGSNPGGPTRILSSSSFSISWRNCFSYRCAT
jgi:hypothetical protein